MCVPSHRHASSSIVQYGELVGTEHPRPDNKVLIVTRWKGKPFRCPVAYIETELSVSPHLILTPVDVERAPTHRTEQDIMPTDDEFPVVEANWETPVTAPS
jgi:hypothetical protein